MTEKLKEKKRSASELCFYTLGDIFFFILILIF